MTRYILLWMFVTLEDSIVLILTIASELDLLVVSFALKRQLGPRWFITGLSGAVLSLWRFLSSVLRALPDGYFPKQTIIFK